MWDPESPSPSAVPSWVLAVPTENSRDLGGKINRKKKKRKRLGEKII